MNDDLVASRDSEGAPAGTTTAPSTWREKLGVLMATLGATDAGVLAALRRPDASHPPAEFYRVTAHLLTDTNVDGRAKSDRARDDEDQRWLVIASAIASAMPSARSDRFALLRKVPLGDALAFADVAELRVVRLLEAPLPQLPAIVRAVVHQLVQKAQPFDATDLAELVLSAERPNANHSRRRVARAFYRHQEEKRSSQ